MRILRRIYKIQRAAYLHRRYSLSFVAVFVALVGWASQSVHTSNDPLLFFSEDNIHRLKLEEVQATFGDAKTTLIVLNGEEPGAPERLLEAERYLSEILLDPDHDLYVDFITKLGSVTATLPALGYPTEFTTLEDVQFLAGDHPALREYFFNEDQSATFLVMSLEHPDQDDAALIEAYREQIDLATHMEEKFPDIEIAIVGNITTFEALRGAFERDSKYLYPATVIVNFLVLLLAFGNLRVTVSVLVVAGVSVILTQGIAGWSGYIFAGGTASSFSIVLTLTVASLIHVVHAMGQRQRRLPFQSSESIILASFRKLTVPVMLAHITTAVGFLSLNYADAPAFKAMGNLVAIGLVFSMLLSLFVAPIVLKSRRMNLVIRDDKVRALSRWFADIWTRIPIRAGIIVTLLSVAAMLGLTRITFDDQITNNFPEDHSLRVGIDKIATALGWSHSIDLVLKYDEGEMITPEAFADIETLIGWVENQVPVAGVTNPLPLINDCLAHRTPPFEGALKDVPQKMLNFCVRSSSRGDGGFFGADFTLLHMQILLPRIAATGVRELAENIEAEAALLGFDDQTAVVTGIGVMSAYLTKVNTQNMLVGTLMAMLVVSLMIGLFLRSPVLAIMSIFPNILPAMAALGLWVWMYGAVGMAASIIAAVTFGIVVDDTIHILYALSRGKDTRTRAGVHKVLCNVTPGVLTTTATLGFGLSILMFSGFEVNRQLGFLTSVTIFTAFFFDVFVLPGLYSVFRQVRAKTKR